MAGSKDVIELLSQTPQGIGYVGAGSISDGVKVMKLSVAGNIPACAPTPQHVRSGTYPLARPFYLYTLGPPSGTVKALLDWMLSPEGQKVVEHAGYMAAR